MGYDTARLVYPKKIEGIKNKELQRVMIVKYSDFDKGKIAIKPFKQDLATLKETLSVTECFDREIGEKSKMDRIDIAYDTELKLDENIELFKAFLICLNIVRSKNTKIYETYKDIFERGNIKIDNGITLETTIYCCIDKLNRKGNTRIENRVKNIRNDKENIQNLQSAIINYNAELEEILARLETPKNNILDMINKKVVPKLVKQYPKSSFSDLTNYINHLNDIGALVTKETVEGLLLGLGYKTNVNKFIKVNNQRKKQKNKKKLSYANKTGLKKLIKELIKLNNETLNN